MNPRLLRILLVLTISGFARTQAQDATPEGQPLSPNAITPENAAQIEQQYIIETTSANALGWTQDGQLLLNTWSNGPTGLFFDGGNYDVPVSQLAVFLEGENPGAYTTRFGAMGTYVALVTNDGGYGIDVWDLTSGGRVAQIPLESSPETFAIAPDGSHLYYSLGDEQLYTYDVTAGQAAEPVEFEDDILRIVARPDGTQLALNVDDDLVLYSLETGAMTTIPTGIGSLRRMAFNPNGGEIAVAKADIIEVYDLESQEQVGELDSGVTGSIHNGLAYSPDGALLATGREGMLEIYDTSTGERLIELTPPDLTSAVTTLTFSPDGSQLAFINPMTSVEVWGVPQ
jgi:WD40 repeat protein